MTTTYDWSKFTLRIDIQASLHAIYEAWTSQEILELWFLKTANFVDANGISRTRYEAIAAEDNYRWTWHGYGDEVEEKGEYFNCKRT